MSFKFVKQVSRPQMKMKEQIPVSEKLKKVKAARDIIVIQDIFTWKIR